MNDYVSMKMRITDLHPIKRTSLCVDKWSKRMERMENASSLQLEKNLPNISDKFASKMADTLLVLSTGVSLIFTELYINTMGDKFGNNDVAVSMRTSLVKSHRH